MKSKAADHLFGGSMDLDDLDPEEIETSGDFVLIV